MEIINQAIFGRNVSEALEIARAVSLALGAEKAKGPRRILIECNHDIQRQALLNYLRTATPVSLVDVDLHLAIPGPSLAEAVRTPFAASRSPGAISIYGVERSPWKTSLLPRFTLRAQFGDELLQVHHEFTVPIILWLKAYASKKLKQHAREYARVLTDEFTVPCEGAIWAADSAAALSLVEEDIFSQTKEQRQEWVTWFEDRVRWFHREGREFEELVTLQRLGLAKHTLNDFHAAKARFEQVIDRLSKMAGRLDEAQGRRLNKHLARTYYYHGALLEGLGHRKQAMENYEAGLHAAELSRCKFTHYYLDHQIKARGTDIENKLGYFEKQLATFQYEGNDDEQSHMLYHIGVVYQDIGDYDEAIAFYHRSEGLLPVWNRAWLADLLHQVGTAEFARGEYEIAKQNLERSRDLMNELGMDAGLAVVYRSLAALYSLQRGREADYAECLRQVLELRRRCGLPPMENIPNDSDPMGDESRQINTDRNNDSHTTGQEDTEPIADAPGNVQAVRGERPRVFISHSSKDKTFVRRLVNDLKAHNQKVWFDEKVLRVGDSIVDGINGGLKETDYVVVVLSKASVKSKWVNAELNAALMKELSGKGTAILPILKEDCEVPPLLHDRVFADFRRDYAGGLAAVMRVFEQETRSAASLSQGIAGPADSCLKRLSELRLADLRRVITKGLNRVEVGTIWYSTFEERMEDVMHGREKVECVIELLERARERNNLRGVIEQVCADRADLAAQVPAPSGPILAPAQETSPINVPGRETG
jgi:tetratricopeptide (TPR) repeat protein